MQVSSMIHSARSTVSPLVNIVFALNLFVFLLDFEKLGTNIWTVRRTTCAKTMITSDRDCGSAEWINTFITGGPLKQNFFKSLV